MMSIKSYQGVTCTVRVVENFIAEDREVECKTKTEGVRRGRLNDSIIRDSHAGLE